MEKVSTPRLMETLEDITNIKHSPYVLYFQPQICLNSHEILGIEVLLRKRNHDNKIINPAEFIPELEKTKEIISVGKWIIKNAVLQLAKWQHSGYKGLLSINISVVQLTDESLIPFIKDVLEHYQVHPSQIEFELTESFPVENGQLLFMLDRLKQMGVRLALDDFGTGFSSLSYLEQLPIDTLKIDRAFICKIIHSTQKVPVLDAIINLASELSLQVVAEGVEHLEQLIYLLKKQCDRVQGFYFFKPMPADELERILSNHR